MPVGEVVWDPCMALAINCHCSLICCLGNMTKNKTHLSLSLFVHCIMLCRLQSLRKGTWCSLLELHTPVQMKVLVLVIVLLSPNTLSFISAQGSGPFTGHLSAYLESTVNLAYSFQAAEKKTSFNKEGRFFFPSQQTLEMAQKHLSHPDNSGSSSDLFTVLEMISNSKSHSL